MSQDRESPDLFGGLPIVMIMGDFFQFPPVKGTPLWKESKFDKDADGLMIWRQFTNVIMLEEQMRQAKDPNFRELLGRARAGSLTKGDPDALNKKVISSLFMPELDDATFVVKLNALRHHINRVKMEHFARSRGQRIYIFVARHSRIPSSITLEDLLKRADEGSKAPCPCLFFYTLGMPVVLLANISTPLGQVNGTRGTALG